MKTRRILMGALTLAMVAATVIACTKEKETKVAQQASETEEVARKPIATYDNATGKMTYHVSIEQLQEAFDRSSVSKDDNRFIVEALEIVPLPDSEEKGIRFSVIDTESEKSFTAFLGADFLEKKAFNNSIVYYIAVDVESGNFNFTNFSKNGVYTLTLSNFEVVGIEAIPDSLVCMAPRPKVTVTCESRGCVPHGCSVYYDRYGNPQGCTQCGNTPSEYVYCIQTITSGGGGGYDWLGYALTIFFGLLPYL